MLLGLHDRKLQATLFVDVVGSRGGRGFANADASEENIPAFPAKSALVLCCFGGYLFAGSVSSHEEKADEILLGKDTILKL